jgi:hypothetical protein
MYAGGVENGMDMEELDYNGSSPNKQIVVMFLQS